MAMNKEPATPPMIGKIGPYTVFVTPPPPPTPKPSSIAESPKRKNVSESRPVIQPPVLPPPVQYDKSASAYDSKFGFFWDAVAKVQNAHSSLDDYVAHWFGLNQSKYQWALDDYYEKKGVLGMWYSRRLSPFYRTRLMQKLKMHPPKHKVCNMLVGQGRCARHLQNLFDFAVYISKYHIKYDLFSGWMGDQISKLRLLVYAELDNLIIGTSMRHVTFFIYHVFCWQLPKVGLIY